jgi:hypothetical protein
MTNLKELLELKTRLEQIQKEVQEIASGYKLVENTPDSELDELVECLDILNVVSKSIRSKFVYLLDEVEQFIDEEFYED